MFKVLMSSVLAGCVTLITATASAAPAAPSDAHPRLWLDDTTQSRFAELAGDPGSAVAAAVERCADVRANPGDYDRGGWQGFEWAKALSACLVSYEATGSADDAATAIFYFEVLLDDYQDVGDGLGGDDVVRHDTGYAIRTFAAYSAIAYDWLYDAPGMTSALRAKALQRFAAWSTWYRDDGYLNHDVGANYHAGWVFAATLMAIAQSGDSADDSLWTYVVDEIFGVDMAAALAEGGVLDGGDWAEGWQYGPLSVLSYALSARALADHGVTVPGMQDWTRDVLVRHVYAQTPDRVRTFAAGDTGSEEIHLDTSVRTLFAALLGPAADETRSWAAAELDTIGWQHDDILLFSALAEAEGVSAQPFPREQAPTAHHATGTGNFYARSSFEPNALWSVFQCAPPVVPDHQHFNAGNLVLSRGNDDLLVDPSPYGSLSTLTGNAPTVVSDVLSEAYRPSQGPFGRDTSFAWARQTASGLLAARCDYADQYSKVMQSGPASDIAEATRDVVVLGDDEAGTAVVFDRASTGDVVKYMDLRFRTPGALSLAGDVARADVGGSSLVIQRVSATGGSPEVRTLRTDGQCWEMDRGRCDLARFPGSEYHVEIPGPAPSAVHVLDAVEAGAEPGAAVLEERDGYDLVTLERAGVRYAVVDAQPGASLSYEAPASSAHVVLDAPASAEGRSVVTAAPSAGGCAVTVSPAPAGEEGLDARPLIVDVAADCQVTASDDAAELPGDEGGEGGGDQGGGDQGPGSSQPELHGGCAAAGGAGPGGLLLLAGALALGVRRRRRA